MSVNRELIEVFDDCITRLNTGQTVADCLSAHPLYADQLLHMLETVLVAKRGVSVNPAELLEAKNRVRTQVFASNPRRVLPLRSFALAAAVSILVLLLVVSLIAENSLPGDALYNLKLFTESLRGSSEKFEQRRIDEIGALLAAGREVEVAFVGEIEAIDSQIWTVAGLTLQTPENTPGRLVGEVGKRVQIEARTRSNGTLLALNIEAVPTPEMVEGGATAAPPTAAASTASTAAFTPTPSPTLPPTAAVSPTGTPVPQSSPTHSPTAAPTFTATSAVCTSIQPSGWITYRVQSGDTLSGLAVATGTTLDELIQVNCITDPRFLIVGQVLFLPIQPTNSGDDDNSGGEDTGGSIGGNDDDDSDSDDD